MASHTHHLPVGFDTTGFVADRFAKIATTYTGGFTRVQYAASVCTNVKGMITLPVEMKTISDGTYLGADFDVKETLALSYIHHEMGHDDVELRLRAARDRREKKKATFALYVMVPEELKRIAMKPRTAILLTSEWLDSLPSYGRFIANAYGGNSASATKQLLTLTNAAEDPRQEAIVSARWPGAGAHLAFGNEHSLVEWGKRVEKIKASGKDSEFLIFAIGLVYELHGKAQPFGEKVQTQIDACQDLIELYRDEGDWKTAHGYYDAVNFSLACLGRVYRREVAAEAPVPTCPSCGSENVKGTLRAGKATVICLDCGHREEMDVEEGEGAGSGEGSEMESDTEDEDGSEEGEEGAGDGSEDEGEGEEADEDSDDGEGDSDDGEGDSDDGEDGEGESEDGGTGGSESPRPEVGALIRVKATGGKARITKVYPDGSVDCEEVAE